LLVSNENALFFKKNKIVVKSCPLSGKAFPACLGLFFLKRCPNLFIKKRELPNSIPSASLHFKAPEELEPWSVTRLQPFNPLLQPGACVRGGRNGPDTNVVADF
jgi:hypothetical protein